MHSASPMPLRAASGSCCEAATEPWNCPTTSCAGSSRVGDCMGNAAASAAQATQAHVKLEPADLAFTAHPGQHICVTASGPTVLQTLEVTVKVAAGDACSSCHSSSNPTEDTAASSPGASTPVATSTLPGKTEKEDAAIAQMMAHEMLCIVLSGVTSNEMKTAALNQLLHHPATSAAAQEMIGQHAGLYELLRLCSHGDFMHSYQASAILRRYGGSSLEAGLHLQRLLAVISCCQDLKSDLAHLSQLGWIAPVRSCNLLCSALLDPSCVHMMLRSGCIGPLITLLRTISSARFHFEANFEASEGAAKVIAAATRLLHWASCLSEEAKEVWVQAGLIAILLENPAPFNGTAAEPEAAGQLLQQLLHHQSRSSATAEYPCRLPASISPHLHQHI